jgi:tRNA(fMet)-specific endonuclease VapC
LRYRAANKAFPKLTAQVEVALEVIETPAVDARTDEIHASIRVQLESAGTPIGGDDLSIASQAMTLDLTLVTDNEREFSGIDGLRIQTPPRAPSSR